PAPRPTHQRRAGRAALVASRHPSWRLPEAQTRPTLPLPQMTKMCRPLSPGMGERWATRLLRLAGWTRQRQLSRIVLLDGGAVPPPTPPYVGERSGPGLCLGVRVRGMKSTPNQRHPELRPAITVASTLA